MAPDKTMTDDTIEVPRKEFERLKQRIDELEEDIEEFGRYTILRDIVASKTDLDVETIDHLVEQRREEVKGR